MHRSIVTLLLLLVLAACGTSGDTDTEPSAASGDADASIGASASADASGAGSAGPAGEASPACTEAFAPLAELNLESTSDLGDLPEIEATVESCESLDDWLAGAQGVVAGEVDPSTAQLLLGLRCSNPSLSNTPVCLEVAAS